MDDLRTIHEALATEPSEEVVARGRRDLVRAIEGEGHRRARLWAVGGVGAVAAAAAVAVAVVAVAQPGAERAERPGQKTATGRQILLAAADTALATTPRIGAYWNVKIVYSGPDLGGTQDTWTGHDGTTWLLAPGGTGVWKMTGPVGFSVGGSAVSLTRLQHLPADPARLRAWMFQSYAHRQPLTPGGPPPAMGQGGFRPTSATVALGLSDLLYQVPAPPAVRAAAFRALAALPGVTRIGTVRGGEEVAIAVPPPPASKFRSGKVPAGAGRITLVIDPATAQLSSIANDDGTETVLRDAWTNTMPRVATAPPKR